MQITLNDVLDYIESLEVGDTRRTKIIDCLNRQSRASRAEAKAQFHVGQTVTFIANTYQHITGTIRKINRINIDVVDSATGRKWRVSPKLLHPVK